MESPMSAHQIPGRRSMWITGGYRVCSFRAVGAVMGCMLWALFWALPFVLGVSDLVQGEFAIWTLGV